MKLSITRICPVVDKPDTDQEAKHAWTDPLDMIPILVSQNQLTEMVEIRFWPSNNVIRYIASPLTVKGAFSKSCKL